MPYIFGPVPSRRLGRSLGVDLVPFKTCTYDCIYCQLGRTTNKTVERHEWVPLDAVLAELQDKLATKPDYLTLSGSGEPTLFSRLDDLIDRIRSITDVPVAVLTNGSLLWQKEVRRHLMDVAFLRRVTLARPEGVEPPTLGSEVRCSIQLSYGRVPAILPPGLRLSIPRREREKRRFLAISAPGREYNLEETRGAMRIWVGNAVLGCR